mmetsp:Transcript_19589/g.23215  ORF Transcript_19589/g.23215 Transcript_19589/m.23215 type:complete len:106 (+) Transcript_19589:20-337(+)
MVDVGEVIDDPFKPDNTTIPTNSTDFDRDTLDNPVSQYVFNSTFADHDFENEFEILPHGELNSDVGGRQLLYGERYFPEFALEKGLRESDWSYNSIKYDGYMYYV